MANAIRLLTPGDNCNETLIIEGDWNCQEYINTMVPEHWRTNLSVFVDGVEILDPETYWLKETSKTVFAVVPAGGQGGLKRILMMVVLVIVTIVAYAFGQYYVGGITLPAILGGGTIAGGTLLAGAVAIAGSLIMSALIKPPSIGNLGDGTAQKRTFFITGQSNQFKRYDVVPRIYGKVKFYPPIASNPKVDNAWKYSGISALYDFGSGWVILEDIRIGDTDADEFDPDFAVHSNSFCTQLRYNNRKVSYDQFSVVLQANNSFTVMTRPLTIQAHVTFSFPRGLVKFTNDGKYTWTSIQIRIEYRKVGTTAWSTADAKSIVGLTAKNVADGSLFWGTNNTITYLLSNSPTRKAFKPDGSSAADIDYYLKRGGRLTWIISSFNEANYLLRYPFIKASGWKGTGQEYFKSKGWRNTNPYVNGSTPSTGAHPLSIEISGTSAEPVTMYCRIGFEELAQYEFRCTRLTADNTKNNIQNDIQIALVTSFGVGAVLNLREPHTMLEMQVTANEKLSGTVQNLSAVATSVLRTTTNGTTFKYKATRNPIWIALDILTGTSTYKPVPNNLIDWPSWIYAAGECEKIRSVTVNGKQYKKKRYTCDTVVDYETTVQELLNNVLSTCRALIMVTTGGKYGIFMDEERDTPRQLITTTNSWGFSGVRTFSSRPHALRVGYTNPANNWQIDELVVYDDGYNANNATDYDELNTFGVTDIPSAFSFGRYMLAQNVWRSESFTVSMDIEHLAVQRGDLVRVAHDVPNVGGFPCRVVGVVGNIVEGTYPLDVPPTGYIVRLSDGTIRSGLVTLAIDDSHFQFDNVTGIQPDDLMIVGLLNKVYDDYIITQITPSSDFTAELTMVQYDARVYSADQHPIPDWNPGFGDNLIGRTNLITSNLVVAQKLVYRDRFPFCEVTLTWTTTGFSLDTHILAYKQDGSNQWIDFGTEQRLTHVFTKSPITDQEFFSGRLSLRVTPRSTTGYDGKAATVQLTMLKDNGAPAQPVNFGLNVQKERIDLFWDHPSVDFDIDYYMIRYSPNVANTEWNAAQILAKVSYPNNRISVGARTGTYMIRTVDTSGNISRLVTQRTTVDRLPDINVIGAVNDAPTWNGIKTNIRQAGSILILDNVLLQQGIYTMNSIFDLGEIYQFRVSNKIQAYGILDEDYIINWVRLSSVAKMSVATSDLWDASLEVSVSSQTTFMSSWVTLSSIAQLSTPSNVWSAWRPTEVGDFTGQYVRFRLVLDNFDNETIVVVTDGLIEIDMPDRIVDLPDIIIPVGGTTINFDPEFKETPAIAISIDGSTLQLAHRIQSKDRFGVNITLFDVATGNPAAGKIDLIAKGYGRQKQSII